MLILVVAGCSNSDSVRTSEVAFVESYAVSADDKTIEVWVDVGCVGTRIRVLAVEATDAVKLFALRNSPDCRGNDGDVGFRSSTVVELGAALGDRPVVDVGCEFVLGETPCTARRAPTSAAP